ncbi:UPF0538 protein C2orf76 homolog [Glandiceps talaboti]
MTEHHHETLTRSSDDTFTMATVGGREDSPCVTLTVRLIRSFEHRNIKSVVFHNVLLDVTTKEFMETIDKEIQVRPGIPPPVRKYKYNTLKILHTAHGAKTNTLAINLEDDDTLILKETVRLQDSGVKNETELSYFKLEDYEKFKANPEIIW